jgi:hypothetical protein
MRLRDLLTASLLGLVSPAAASEIWVQQSPNVLFSDANSEFFARLEIKATRDCKAVEVRLWVEVSQIHITDKPDQTLLELALSASDTLLASQGRIIEFFEEFVPNTSIAHITLGAANWDVLEYLERLNDDTIFALSGKISGQDIKNEWEVADLPVRLRQLKLACEPEILGTLT